MNNDELIKGLRKLWESHILNPFHTYFPNLLPISLQLHLYTFLFLYLLHSLSYLFSSSHPWVFTIYRLAGTISHYYSQIQFFTIFYTLFTITNFLFVLSNLLVQIINILLLTSLSFLFYLVHIVSYCLLPVRTCSLFPVPSGSFANTEIDKYPKRRENWV